ncbi:ShlB/FhaC/HecB family hemolysin secretion/activation protein [Asticcacaulis sp. EMRT-3]|uniref:ShlB/FhaC/HecB family hemolysin secretion/activation protein n=1 Tax=Asticcacaulis sp. EMRT-3 TaxID=3040349 RepID=UPI0024AFF717|nr:ShlB/FhaC/HecB family hemolysin secretion/activation protein [Asticcacaulis sp. EMRT-3]MDI7776392.1 ShlB/FhaC/HecB family hemolysin secretion/activation protein [Asticcacaulis sp. EMRT-3]
MSLIKNLRRTAVSLSPLLFAALQIPAQAHAQAIERHLPEVPQGVTKGLVTPNAVPGDQDATPIGPALTSIVLLGPAEAPHNDAAAGVSVGDVYRLQDDAARADIAARLRPFIGQTLSRKLIAEIEAAIAQDYRDLNYPFVSLSTPEQEIDHGVLQVRVIEFTAGNVSVKAAPGQTISDKTATYVRSKIALQPGDAINARELTYDLDGLNRYPFRQVQAAFTPGAALGESDMLLSVRQLKPWQAYGGYSNDGSPSTSYDRYFIGGAAGGLLGRDSVLSVQATASRDALAGEKDPHYRSVALNYTIPVGRRGLIEASADTVTTYQSNDPFMVGLKATEGSLGYRWALSKLYGDQGITDARFGIEASHQTGTTYFNATNVYEVSVESYKVFVGLHHAASDAAGAANWDLSLHMSPGGVTADNSAEQAYLYSQGRLPGATYSYLSGSYDRVTTLGDALSLQTQVFGQFTPVALPRTDQAGLGGSYLVRGYSLDNGAVDTALIVRNELHIRGATWGSGSIDPYGFVDLGHGRDNYARSNTDLASLGAGANIRLISHVALKIDAAVALAPNGEVRAGDLAAHTRLQLVF